MRYFIITIGNRDPEPCAAPTPRQALNYVMPRVYVKDKTIPYPDKHNDLQISQGGDLTIIIKEITRNDFLLMGGQCTTKRT